MVTESQTNGSIVKVSLPLGHPKPQKFRRKMNSNELFSLRGLNRVLVEFSGLNVLLNLLRNSFDQGVYSVGERGRLLGESNVGVYEGKLCGRKLLSSSLR